MIIEGKHAEVGQGIFISDIQEGSAAEQVSCVLHGFTAWLLGFLNLSCCRAKWIKIGKESPNAI